VATNHEHIDPNKPESFLRLPVYESETVYTKDENGNMKSVEHQVPYDRMYGYLCYMGIEGSQIELIEIKTKEQIQKLKSAFQLRFPHLIKRLINVLLSLGEEKLACWFTAYYEINIDETDIRAAIEKE
jgi:hypothetical protein